MADNKSSLKRKRAEDTSEIHEDEDQSQTQHKSEELQTQALKEKEIDGAILALRHHIGMRVDKTEPTPSKAVLFFIELSPYSSRGSKCKHTTHTKLIESAESPSENKEGPYRVAVQPGIRMGLDKTTGLTTPVESKASMYDDASILKSRN